MKNPFEITGNKERLEPLIQKIGMKWGQYNRDSKKAIKALADAGLILVPETAKFESLADRQLLTLEHVVSLPDDKLIVIPSDSGMFPQDNSARVAKKAPLLNVRFDGKLAAIEMLRKRLMEVRIDQTLVGYDWQNPLSNDNRYVVTTLVDCIKGFRLDGIIPYLDVQNYSRSGHMIVKAVPSLSSRKRYDITVEGIALADLEQGNFKPSETYALMTDHSCKKGSFYSIKKGRYCGSIGKTLGQRKGKDKLECYHSVFAVKKAKNRLRQMGMEMHDPFIEPGVASLKIFDAARSRIFYEDAEGYLRPLDETYAEILLWKSIAYRNHERESKR